MRTSDFITKPSSKIMNETLNKKFGEKLDIENYSDEQLTKANGLIESRIAVLKKGKFNETLDSEEFHRLKLMQDIVRTAITERAKNNKYAIGMAAAKKQAGITAKHAHDLPKSVVTKGHEIAKKIKEGAKPDYLDFDKDGNKKEPMKKALKDKAKKGPVKVDEISNELKRRAVDSALAKGADAKKAGWNKKGDEKKGKKADAARDTFRKKTDQGARIVMKMKESVERYLSEGEEGKAEIIMAVKDMVDKFTNWSENIAQMQAQTAMEMADSIRNEMGPEQADQFTSAVQPALDAAFQAVKSAREALNTTVGTLTGEAPPAMGAEPGMPGDDMGGDDMGMEPDMGAEPDMGGDDMGGDDMGMEPDVDLGGSDRMKRESIENRLRLTKILAGK